ncbi:MAG: lysophospholipid acyltransferase family protein [Salibacteraceae bacterium]
MSSLLIFFLKLISHLPLWVLYKIGSVLGWLLLNVFHYRKNVILSNISTSFPKKSKAEIDFIMREYYRYLSDVMVETIALWNIDKQELMKRCRFENPELLKPYESNSRNVIIMMGHSGNWEWAGLATELYFNFTILPVYRSVKDPVINHFLRTIRSRFGSHPVLDSIAFSEIKKHDSPHAVAMLADQTPGAKKGWWIEFLNQPTPFFRGSEILAKRLNYDVVFAHVKRENRGYYCIKLSKFDGNKEDEYVLTTAFAKFLEMQIKQQPENWLWSHKRWKHQPNEKSIWMEGNAK